MSIEDEARAEAIERYASRLIEDYDGDRYAEDEYGYDATARQAFVDGAEWASRREPSEAEVEVIARAIFAVSAEGRQGWRWPIDDFHRKRDMERARTVLLSARNTRETNE